MKLYSPFRENARTRISFRTKAVALTLLFALLFQLMEPTVAFALTSGPSQPEAAQFQPVGATDMVDMFTGDFGYNIPLLELPGPNGGYPFNLSYQSGTTMDQEASWVGLGWNVNAGAIVRNMRGLPDEFNGGNDNVKRVVDMKPNETYGAGTSVSMELAGGDWGKAGMSVNVKVYENTYRGIGYGVDLGTSFSKNVGSNMNAGVGFNMSFDSQEGVGANVSATIRGEKEGTTSKGWPKKENQNLSLGIGFHSTGGLNGSISGSIQGQKGRGEGKKIHTSDLRGSSAISFSVPAHTPSIGMEMRSLNLTTSTSMGMGSNGLYNYWGQSGFYSRSKVAKTEETLPAYGYMYLQNQEEAYAMADFNREKDGVLYRESKNLASPSLTYDFYVINGQGTGGMFRPYRQEYGHIHEQERISSGAGGSLGFDMGLPGHYGFSGTFNYSRSRTGDWEDGNDALEVFKFYGKGNNQQKNNDPLYEGAYFRMAGDQAAVSATELASILGEAPVKLKNNGHSLTKTLQASRTSDTELTAANMFRPKRMPRATTIIPYSNEAIMSKGTDGKVDNEVLTEYDIEVYRHIATGKTIGSDNLGAVKAYQSLPGTRGKGTDGKMANGNHLAGQTILQPDGKRYVYALPAYNNTQVQETFSIGTPTNPTSVISYITDGGAPRYKHTSGPTDEYHERVTISRYPHSYLLTAVLGDDYVDADKIAGPSEGDFGYWVKFNYVQTSDNYQWRAPFSGANYLPGSAGSSTDDKGSYTYGKKEVWYLASAETQTHIIYFEMSPRQDGLGAMDESGGASEVHAAAGAVDINNKLYKLDRIKLYSKTEHRIDPSGEPLQTVHFTYDYSLCKGTRNSLAPGRGKLTLKSVYFTHKHDRTGALSPYQFEYGGTENNPSYDLLHNRYDRWGTYRSLDYGNDIVNQEFPYTPQFNPDERQSKNYRDAFKSQTDKNASAWHLRSVKLPSGGTIHVDYESDDYAYVQHKKATQMFRVAGAGTLGSVKLFEDDDKFWGSQYSTNDTSDVNKSRRARRLYFKLEEPIQAVYTEAEYRQQLISRYLECLLDKEKNSYDRPLSAKFKTRLRGSIEEYISGYFFAQLDDTDKKPLCGVAGNTVSIDGTQAYEYGYIVLDFVKIDDSPVYYPPFAVAAWQYMRINLPRVLTGMGDFETGENKSEMEHLTRIASLGSWMNTLRTMFTGYRKYCFEKEFANTLTLNESFIRLDSPDGVKFGGGSRVKKLYVQDDPVWGDDKIGQVYDYTMQTRDGKTVSSGVASYEPVTGGEENVLRTAKFHKQAIPFFTDNNLFFELPVNESYYPAPRVGYSKVTVTSLATADVQAKIAQNATPETYMGIQTTGRTVHEFYTAREFPLIAEATECQPFGKPSVIPLPFVGMVQISKLTATQGYSIRLNDMHGKPKSVSTYASKKEGGFQTEPITRVQYVYRSKPFSYEGESVWELDNLVEVLKDDPQMKANANQLSGGYDKALTEKMLIGYEYDFFADFRKAVDEAGTGGLDFNVDIFGGGPAQFPLPFPWPSFNFSHTSTRTAVTNKIISRAGILQETIATDGQSTVRTQNLVYDKYTGEPLVTTVNNNYDNQIYNYEYPAHLAYEGTGTAYDNILLEFTGTVSALPDGSWTLRKTDITATPPFYGIGNNPGMGTPIVWAPGGNYIPYTDLYDMLNEGDEFLVEFTTSNFPSPTYLPNGGKQRATLVSKKMGTSYVNCQNDPQLVFNWQNSFTWRSGIAVRMLLVRSGKRNLLNLKTGALKTLLNPGSAATLENSPLYKREKETTLSAVQPALYDSLTSQISGFLNQILDCNGQFPVGTYYLDEARFLKNDGGLRYPELFGLLESVNVFDNCGMQNECMRYNSVPLDPPRFEVVCHPNCLKPANPGVPSDIYTPQPVNCVDPGSGAYTSQMDAFITDWAQTQVSFGLTPQQAVTKWNDVERNKYHTINGRSLHTGCRALTYVTTKQECAEHACYNCGGILGVENNTHIYSGYHLVFKFRPEFATGIGESCYTAHCIARAKYRNGQNQLSRTRIGAVQYQSPGRIKFLYEPGQSAEPGNTSTYCMKSYEIRVPATYYKIKNVLAASATELSPLKANEELYPSKNCAPAPSNLYAFGLKGIWRAVKTYYYKDERFQGLKTSNSAHMTSMLNLATDGVFDGEPDAVTGLYDKNMYLFNWNSFLAKKIHSKWLTNETVTAFSKNSQSTEARDVLGLYSSVQFDSKGYLPVAVGRNMRKSEMFYENFDNTGSILAVTPTGDIDGNHISDSLQVKIMDFPFTGRYSLCIKKATQFIIPRSQFAPQPGKPYLFSMWLGGFNTLYSPEEIDARFTEIMNTWVYFLRKDGSIIGQPTRIRTSGKIIEGKSGFWRKQEMVITAPAGADHLLLWLGATDVAAQYSGMYRLLNANGNILLDQFSFYDDIRIQPADGLMQTYVYDHLNYRLSAEGDENNFPTLYGYAPSGALMTVKKLTEEGIKTLKEIRSNTLRRSNLQEGQQPIDTLHR